MCRLVFATDLKAQRLDAGFSAQVLGEGDHGLAQFLPAEWLAQIKLVEQCEAAMKFQAEAEREREVSVSSWPRKMR